MAGNLSKVHRLCCSCKKILLLHCGGIKKFSLSEFNWCQHSVTTNADKVTLFIFHINNDSHYVSKKKRERWREKKMLLQRHDKFSFHVRE